jgi:hypothetical protein
MANMCSNHHPSRGPVEGCVLCHTHPRDVFPDWDQKLAEAKARGKATCEYCEFVRYRSSEPLTEMCPKCQRYIYPPTPEARRLRALCRLRNGIPQSKQLLEKNPEHAAWSPSDARAAQWVLRAAVDLIEAQLEIQEQDDPGGSC